MDTESPFRSRKYSDIASDLIRQEILAGELVPGQRINEIALSERLQISRSPLREALRALDAEGLVRMVSGRGSFVASPDLDTVKHLTEVRVMIEVTAARLAAERVTDEARESLRAVISDIAFELEKPDANYPVHIDFHHALARVSANPKLLQMSDEIERQLRVVRNARALKLERAQNVMTEHSAIAEAVIAADPDAAAEAMRVHVEASNAGIIEILESARNA